MGLEPQKTVHEDELSPAEKLGINQEDWELNEDELPPNQWAESDLKAKEYEDLTEEQYKEFLKENLKVTFFDDLNKKTIKGQLEEVDEISIKLEIKDGIQEIPFSSIIKANLLI